MKQSFIFILMIFAFSACKKDTQIKNENATITFTGDVASDGCGYLIKINSTGTSYHADNLSETYQKDSLPVTISYHLLDKKFSCGLISNNISVIELDAIRIK